MCVANFRLSLWFRRLFKLNIVAASFCFPWRSLRVVFDVVVHSPAPLIFFSFLIRLTESSSFIFIESIRIGSRIQIHMHIHIFSH